MLRARIGTWVVRLLSGHSLASFTLGACVIYEFCRNGSSSLRGSWDLHHSGLGMADALMKVTREDIGKEPFRIFFPAGVVAGIIGVALWPLHFLGVVSYYPGQAHVRLMAYGFFGAFIFGFLGTALPRMLSARPLGFRNVMMLAGFYSWVVGTFSFGKILWGDVLLLVLLLFFLGLVVTRADSRKDTPPPGFVLV